MHTPPRTSSGASSEAASRLWRPGQRRLSTTPTSATRPSTVSSSVTPVGAQSLLITCPDNAALSATISSGIRSVYCYTPIGRVKSWKPKLEMDQDLLPAWLFEQLAALCQRESLGDGRVTMGFGFDSFFLPKDVVVNVFNQVRAMGVKTITTHYVKSHFGERALRSVQNHD